MQASHGEEMCDQDFCEGSPLHLGDEEDVPHQVTHGTTQSVPTCRVCEWSGAQSWKLWLKRVRLSMRPADTDVVPERRYYKSVAHARGKEKKLSHVGKLRKNTMVEKLETLTLRLGRITVMWSLKMETRSFKRSKQNLWPIDKHNLATQKNKSISLAGEYLSG